ncbi:MAG: UDP-2,4-diacetamido-2,4,6-trideoxy-beta-L-altropyranose hydrolase [Balneolaceae bacterium]
MTRNLYIRADGGWEIGLGHLVRMSALAEMVKDQFTVSFVCREIPGEMAEELNEQGFRLIGIEEEEEFLNRLKTNDLVVADGYHFDVEYQQSIRSAGVPLVCIDDGCERNFCADLIINHTPGVTDSNYRTEPWTRFALGPDYALLRPAFLKQAMRDRRIDAVSSALVCFGGSDTKNLTEQTLKVLLDFKEVQKISIIAGSSYKHEESLLAMIDSVQKRVVNYHRALDEHQMLEQMLQADVAIVPASGILFEVIAAGCIPVSGTYTENQKGNYEGFREMDAIVDAGTFQPDELKRALKQIQTFTPKKPIDGKSNQRIQKLLTPKFYYE